jgi:PadR family transcriptional regulator PadR
MMLRRSRKADALQGTLDLLVLKTLSRGPQHGYGIALDIQTVSSDMLRVEEGSLYPALHRMEQAGWISAYRITRVGLKHLDEELAKWERLTKAVGKVVRLT